MRKMPNFFLAGLLLVAFSLIVLADQMVTPSAEIQAAHQIQREIALCTVRIDTPNDGYGSGTIISQSDKALILTAAHVVGDVKDVTVHYIDGMDENRSIHAPGKVVKLDKAHDLALVETEPVWPAVARVINDQEYADEFTIFQQCLISGYPLDVHSAHVTQGLISDVNDGGKLRTSADIMYGNSGGGVFVRIGGHWRLVGVLQAVRLLDGQRVHPMPHINFSAGPVTIITFIAQ